MSTTLHSMEAEACCIASVLADPHSRDLLALKPDHFMDGNHRRIWTAIQKTKTPDLASVSTTLNQLDGRNWLPLLLDLMDGTVTVNAPTYAEVIRDCHMRREAIRITQEIIEGIKRKEDNAIDNGVRSLSLLQSDTGATDVTIGQAAEMALKAISERRAGAPMASTGIRKIDNVLGGFHKGDLIIVGARPGTGKTALMLQMAMHTACDGIPIGVFSGEQAAVQLGERAIAATGVATVAEMRSGRADPMALDTAIAALEHAAMYVSDVSAPSIAHVRKQSRKWVHEYGIQAIFVDYLQRMTGDPRLPKHERVGNNARDLKTLAVELQVPVIALAQVNRGVTNRADPRPNMSDLRDSGEIEQEADQIMLLYTDNENENEPIWPAEIILDKNRHGATCVFGLNWNRERMRFEEPKDSTHF